MISEIKDINMWESGKLKIDWQTDGEKICFYDLNKFRF